MLIQAKVITNTTSSGSPQDEIPVQCAEDKVLTRRRLPPRSLRLHEQGPCYGSNFNRLRFYRIPLNFQSSIAFIGAPHGDGLVGDNDGFTFHIRAFRCLGFSAYIFDIVQIFLDGTTAGVGS